MLKVVLTGIPSSGKTSVINSVVERFKERGYRVLVVPETATEYILSGIKPFGDDGVDPIFFQELVLKKQLNKEYLYDLAANHLGKDKTIILYDRGTLDGYAYVDNDDMERVVKDCGETKRDLLLRYDCVLFLEGAAKFFTTENNKARYEKNADESAALRKKLLNSYLGHDNLRIIQPREEMKDKQEEVINVIANMLGNPTRLREQHKYLVESIDIDSLSELASKVEITQDYLQAPDMMEYRVRKIKQGTDTSYHFSIQHKHENGKREITKEEVLSKEEYERMLIMKDERIATVKKIRYSFVYANQYYKLDLFDDGLMLLEVNVTKENPHVTLPDFIATLDDVTNNPDYTNISIARRKKEDYDKRKNNSGGGTDCSGKETQSKILIDNLKKDGMETVYYGFPAYDTPTGRIVGLPYLGKPYLAEELVQENAVEIIDKIAARYEGNIDNKLLEVMLSAVSEELGKGWFKEGAPNVDPKISSLYYAADRAYNIPKIKQIIKNGQNVILDRYIYSNLAHQGGKIEDYEQRKAMYDWNCNLEFNVMGLPQSDIRLFLHMPTEYASLLRAGREEKLDENERDVNHLLHAEKAYIEVARMFDFETIECIRGRSNNIAFADIKTPEEISYEVYDTVKRKLTLR